MTANEALYDTGSDHDRLIVRPRDLFDNAVPCGNSGAAMALLRLGLHTGDSKYQRTAMSALSSVADLMQRVPNGFTWWLCALDFQLARVQEVVVMGAPDDPDTARLSWKRRARVSPLTASTRARMGYRMTNGFRFCREDADRREGHCLSLRELRLPGSYDRSGGVRAPTGVIIAGTTVGE